MTFTPKIIGFCGYPGSGKDEAAKVLVAQGWQRVAFADKLREMALAIDPLIGSDMHGDKISLSKWVDKRGWLEAKKHPEVRRLLQRIGTEAVRDIIGPDTWVQLAERSMLIGKHVVITDCRFPNEAAMIRQRGGLLCWIDRPGCEAPAHNQHSSEAYGFKIDEIINNTGSVEQLHNAVLELAGIPL